MIMKHAIFAVKRDQACRRGMIAFWNALYTAYPKDEREYEARAVERQEERRRREEELKEAAIQQAVAGASGQVKKGGYDYAHCCSLVGGVRVIYQRLLRVVGFITLNGGILATNVLQTEIASLAKPPCWNTFVFPSSQVTYLTRCKVSQSYTSQPSRP